MSDKAAAFSQAAKINDAGEKQFAEARDKAGIAIALPPTEARSNAARSHAGSRRS
jgi:hypothetical protein